jgi:hypothetical protein
LRRFSTDATLPVHMIRFASFSRFFGFGAIAGAEPRIV